MLLFFSVEAGSFICSLNFPRRILDIDQHLPAGGRVVAAVGLPDPVATPSPTLNILRSGNTKGCGGYSVWPDITASGAR